MFDEIFMAQRGVLLRSLQRIVGNRSTAEDLLQETYLRVSAALLKRPVEHLAPFMFQTARNLALDHLRSQRRQGGMVEQGVPAAVIEQVPALSENPETQIVQQQLLSHLDEAIAGLPLRQQQVFMLNRMHGWSYGEIAEHLDVSLSTVQKDLRLVLSLCVELHDRFEER